MKRLRRPRRRGWMQQLAGTVAGWLGAYASTDPRNTITQGFRPRSVSGYDIAFGDLPMLRNQCRDLERRNPTYRGAIEGLVANLVGTGIGLEPNTGSPEIDKRIRPHWMEYLTSCGINGEDIDDLQAQGCREMLNVGALLWRLVILPERAAAGKIPVVVMPLEVEWLSPTEVEPIAAGNTFIMGIELDQYGRDVAYHIRNPDLTQNIAARSARIPAAEMIHWYDKRRALQAHGEPWMAPSIETLFVQHDLVRAELASAKNTAAMSVFIQSSLPPAALAGNTDDDYTTNIPIGSVVRGYPGESVTPLSHTRPSQQIAPFLQMLRGMICAAARIGQRWLDRDTSRANYSSMRADQQDEERLVAPLRDRFGNGTIGRLYKAVLPYLAIKAGIVIPNATYRLIPDGTPYVNPKEDIEAALMSIRGGLSTFSEEAGKRGKDVQGLLTTLREELKDPLLAQIFSAQSTTSGQVQSALQEEGALSEDDKLIARIKAIQESLIKAGMPLNMWPVIIASSGAQTAPGAFIEAANATTAPTTQSAEPKDPEDPNDDPSQERIVETLRPIRDAEGRIAVIERVQSHQAA